jgi:hypothetical protein
MKIMKNYCNFCGQEIDPDDRRDTTNRVYEYRILFTGPLGEVKGYMSDMCKECSDTVYNCFNNIKETSKWRQGKNVGQQKHIT